MILENYAGPMEEEALKNPFPGLRAFEFHENELFFGREGQSEELILKLSKTHFVTVVGTSGSGKSSLVRAGLLPAVYGGLMGKSGSGWHIAILRPGNDPIGNLARALNEPGALALEDDDARDIQTQVNLRRGSLGLVEIVQQARLGPHENLLVLVDQFEELFRFTRISEDPDYANDAARFVKLLLEAKAHPNVYIILTMRSDYLGECARFWDLPEAVNQGQYLIPRMTRQERQMAIMGPVELRGAKIAPGLVNQLLNDMGDSPNQLPILQHALMRIWEKWHSEGNHTAELNLSHYETTGGMTGTLSLHADEAYKELGNEHLQGIAQQLFKCLTEKGLDDKETRRPTELNEICLVIGAKKKEVIQVIETFRQNGRSFLMPPENVALTGNTSIDISHESLINGWQRLKQWVEEEADSARIYRRLVEYATSSRRYQKGELRDPWLQETLDWCEKNHPNRAWACRHHKRFYDKPAASRKIKKGRDKEIFKLAMDFLANSEKARKQREEEKDREVKQRQEEKDRQVRTELRQTRRFATVLAVTSIIILGLAVLAAIMWSKASTQSDTISLLNYRTTMYLAQNAYVVGNFGEANKLLGSSLTENDLRGPEWKYLWTALHNERGTLNEHTGKITSVALSPDNKMIATGSVDQTVKLWDLGTQNKLDEFKVESPVLSVAFSGNSKTVAIGSADGLVTLRKIDGNEEPKVLQPLNRKPVVSLAFDGTNNRLVVGNAEGNIGLWDTMKLMPLWSSNTNTNPNPNPSPTPMQVSVAFSPDGQTIVSGADETLLIWNATSGKSEPLVSSLEKKESLSTARNAILSVAFSPNGETVAAGYLDGHIRLWNSATREEKPFLPERKGTFSILSLTFIDSQKIVSANSDATLSLWDTSDTGQASGKEIRTFKGHSDAVVSVAASRDKNTFISGSSDSTAKVWNVQSPPDVITLSGHKQAIVSVAFFPNSGARMIASASQDNSLKLWDVETRQELYKLQGHTFDNLQGYTFAFSPQKQELIASGSNDNVLRLWSTRTGQLIRKLGKTKQISCLAFSSDGQKLAIGSEDQTVKLWDISTEEEKIIGKHSGRVWSVAFSPDGKLLASGGADKTIKIWRTSDWKELKRLDKHLHEVLYLTFSPDNRLLASGSADNTAIVWDVNSGESKAVLSGHKAAVQSVVFSADGKRLATGSDDGTVKLWDTGTTSWESVGKLALATLQGVDVVQASGISSVAFSPDGKIIVGGRKNGSLDIWRAASDEDIQRQQGPPKPSH